MNEQENIYFRCRKEAAKRNDKLNSREGAAELLGVSVSTLANYELGITKVVPVDSVVMMADLYRAPELKALYCAESCPIGADRPVCTDAGSIERLAVRMAVMDQDGTLQETSRKLLAIAKAGKVCEQERAELAEMAESLGELEQLIQEIRLQAEGRADKEA